MEIQQTISRSSKLSKATQEHRCKCRKPQAIAWLPRPRFLSLTLHLKERQAALIKVVNLIASQLLLAVLL